MFCGPQIKEADLGSAGLPWAKINDELLDFASQLLAQSAVRDLFESNPSRLPELSIDVGPITLDYSRNLITKDVINSLVSLAAEADIYKFRNKLFQGDAVFGSQVSVHTTSRHIQDSLSNHFSSDVIGTMEKIVRDVRSGKRLGFSGQPITTLIVLTIGGGYQGPKLVSDALKMDAERRFDVHFLATNDVDEFHDVSSRCCPEQTLVFVSSKSFRTRETLQNLDYCKEWFGRSGCQPDSFLKQVIYATSNLDEALEHGLDKDNALFIPDCVGGRFSVWSAAGFPIMFSLGIHSFRELLAGAREMDEHFLSEKTEKNMPVILALLSVWNRNFLSICSQLLITYGYRLRHTLGYVQQLEMESNGKRHDQLGKVITYDTAPIVWGGDGTMGQHTYFQHLHQGTERHALDFIVPLSTKTDNNPINSVANALAQAQALITGNKDSNDSLRDVTGGNPCNLITINHLDAHSLGMVLALYEHKVFCQSVLWRCNCFDQWGVELGKSLTTSFYSAISDGYADPLIDSAGQMFLKNKFKLDI